MRVAGKSRRARFLSALGSRQMPMCTRPLTVWGVAVTGSLFWLHGTMTVTMWVDVCERLYSTGRHNRNNEKHTRDVIQHRFYPDEGPNRCQPVLIEQPVSPLELDHRRRYYK